MSQNCRTSKTGLVQIGEPAPPAYWKSVDELHHGPRITGEFPGGLPAPGAPAQSRRDFLSLMGFTLAAAGLAGCRAPVQHAIPLLAGSDQLVPGVPNFYATTCRGCAASCSLLVRQRDGRPIKIEGNTESALFGGGTCATGQATVLSLYDNERLRGPVWHGQPAKWDEVDRHVTEALSGAQGKVVLLSATMNSPSTLAVVEEWRKRFNNFHHVQYEAISFGATRGANGASFGQTVMPHYRLDRARVIVGLEADFLGTWLSPVEFARQYALNRKPGPSRSLHVQFESGMSVTGSNADVRVAVAPSQMGLVALALLRRVAHFAGVAGAPESPDAVDGHKLDTVAEQLWKYRGESLVVCGINDLSLQMVVNALNQFLGNIGKTIDFEQASFQGGGDDQAMQELVMQMERGEVHTLLLHGVNPGYDYAESDRFLKALDKVPLSVSFSDRRDETSSHVHAICPDHHFLEAWGDAEPVESNFSLAQPLIAPLFDTRAMQESLLKWTGTPDPSYYNYLRAYWKSELFPRQKELQNFDAFWETSLQSGVAVLPAQRRKLAAAFHGDWKAASQALIQKSSSQPGKEAPTADNRYELHFYQSVALRDGRHANNPWLQELPDPVTKVTWGNFAAISPQLARKLGISNGEVLRLKTDHGEIEAPAFIQPGQQERTISLAAGYGRRQVGKAGQNVGVSVFPLAQAVEGFRHYSASGVALEKTGRSETLATTQSHFSMEGRPIVLETSMEELQSEHEEREQEKLPTLWADRPTGEHAWGMTIDMNACTGCSACVVACQAENNVPVIGKDQVERTRIMHWIRIDRYYSGSEEEPVSVQQPMMCQHCQNAPCETVCPVLATTTSSEGLNQQVYNRCIGTRYCANNCPYKVRRFNWYNYTDNSDFDFNMANPVGRLVLNPDVVVRSRGVMEKCSLCVQRIQLGKNSALQGKRELVDGEIQTACQQSCPTQAIVFGDLKDPSSRVSQLWREQRRYQVLDELGTRPNIAYLKKVRSQKA
jgi:molybdopterin-containing oxidoreductase family iron-sulfur binding subunit